MKTLQLDRMGATYECLLDDDDHKWISQLGSVSVNAYGYPMVYIRGSKPYTKKLVSRLVAIKHGLIREEENVDHINRNKMDNTRQNLRACNQSQNGANKTKYKENATSVYKGVSAYKDKWQANIKINGCFVAISTFLSEIDAAIAYDIKAREFFGEFAFTNFHDTPAPDIVRVKSLISRQKRHHNSSSKYYQVYYNKVNKCWSYTINLGDCSKTKSGFASELEAALARNAFLDRDGLNRIKRTEIELDVMAGRLKDLTS